MKVLLTGRDGQVGRELRRALAEVVELTATGRGDLDLSRRHEIVRVVREVRPELIINAAAYTAVDRAEEEPDLALAVNARGPEVLAAEAALLRIPIVHYSTDYVFNGDRGEPYREDDPPAPLGVYGRSKAIGDAAVIGSGAAHLVLRVGWVYGGSPGNFLTTMLRLFAERETVRVVADELGSPTWCRDVATATVAVLGAISPGGVRGSPSALVSGVRERGGLYHMAPEGHTSWHGFATEIARLASASSEFPLSVSTLEPIPAREWPSAARRPRDSRLDPGRLRAALGVAIPDWRDGMARCFADLERAKVPVVT